MNQVQPNAVEKAGFAGEWYYLQTVVDTPYSTGFTFVGEQSTLEKITWEIGEQYLIARRSYEFIANAEDESITGSGEEGAPVAIYAIESHFDIRREYNTTTGEESNVVTENTTDRPWYERNYMRVDWSQNLITDTNLFIYARLFNGIRMEPVAYYVQDKNDPNAPKFEHTESGELNYVDIVNKAFIQPEEVYLPGWGGIPVCWLIGTEYLDCAPNEVAVRHSFLKVDPARDYQPMDYTGDRMEQFGYFVTTRAGYDDHYGVVEPSRYHFVNRHNIWEQSHRTAVDGHVIPHTCTMDSHCSDLPGSVCDVDLAKANRSANGECTIPYRERTVKPIVYHVSKSFPQDLFGDAEHMVAEWSRAVSQTVGSLRENECLQVGGGDPAICAAEHQREDAQEAFVLCHNPVVDADHEACGAVGTSAEIGDLRYSLLGWVNEPHLASPLGYGPSAADPETGELIQANAFIYGAEVEELATYARDLVALLNGDLDEETIQSGANVEAWVREGVVPSSLAGDGSERGHVIDSRPEDAHHYASAMDFSWARPSHEEARARRKPRNLAELHQRSLEAVDRIASTGGYGNDSELGAARLQSLHGSAIERQLATPEMRALAGIDPRLPVDETVLAAASPLRGQAIAKARALAAARRKINAESCVLTREFADDGLLGLARAIKRAIEEGDGTMKWYDKLYRIRDVNGRVDYEAVRDMLRHPIFEGTMSHEVGHTMGLRHNFSGSADSLNYHPEYWELRNDGDMAPRAWDPLSEEEITGRIREYQTSTVMDYGNNFVVTDAAGIGHYDEAAIKMGYGDLVEVFAAASAPHSVAHVNIMHRWGWSVNLTESSFEDGAELTAYPYTAVPELAGGIAGVEQRDDVPYTSLVADSVLAMDGIEEPLVDAQGRPAVPYYFCSDEQSDLFPECFLYDAGADSYEQIQSVMDQYWNYYSFGAFRRGRLGFDVEPYYWRVLERYLGKLQQANQSYALDRSWLEDVFADDPSLDEFWTRQDGYGAWTLAIGGTFEMLSRVIATPEPGAYTTRRMVGGKRALLPGADTESAELVVGIEDGRYLETTWDFDAGYYWFDQLDRAGFFFDKVIALQVLTDPTTYFIGRDTASDLRTYQISYYSTFAPAVTGLLRGLNSENWDVIGARKGADGRLDYPNPFELAQGSMDGTPVDPAASFTIQLYASVFGMALIPQTFDHDYLNRARIFVRGGAEGFDLDPSVPVVEFTDPRSGITYVAQSFVDAQGQETGVGASMLAHANELVENGSDRAETELADFVDSINSVRELTWYFGFGSAL